MNEMNIILSHDIDSIKKSFIHIIKRRDRFSIKDILLSFFRVKNIYNNISDIVALEDKYSFHSTFFLPLTLFDISDVIDTLLDIKKSGWSVQLHYVYEPIQAYSLFQLQKKFFINIFRDLIGVRVHMLNINNQLIDMFVKEGIRFDSSYRAEEVNTFNPFIIKADLIEFPIGVMDTDIFGRFYMNEEKALKYIISKMEEAYVSGYQYFVILFHQESFRMRGGRIYKDLLKYIESKNYKVMIFDEVLKIFS